MPPKIKLRPLLYFILLVGFALLGRTKFGVSETAQQKTLSKQGVAASFGYSPNQEGRKIHYTLVGKDSSLPLVIFLHGSPGSSSDFLSLLSDSVLLAQSQLLSLDRPGFGLSSGHGIGEASLAQQAADLKPIIETNPNRKIILVGHSWGGPLALQMAADYGELLSGLVLVGASVDPDLEPSNWYRYIMAFPLFRWFIPRTIVASNTELLPAVRELKLLKPLLSKIKTPYCIVHGLDDSLVPFENVQFMKTHLTQAPLVSSIEIKGMDHFVPWTNPELIKTPIIRLLEEAPPIN